ncbi:MAG: hypothetical protein B6U86_00745 [Candidatus Altiarchaeales archaeon ex4484_43]|nr:MAG: hypothetical protein B6U86_00745 [Candidatus Altiarchaeales archaeon ex4484_43]
MGGFTQILPIASGVLYGEGLTYPDKFLVTDWKRSMYSSWDYEIDPKRTILGDSSVLIYYIIVSESIDKGEIHWGRVEAL